MSNYQVALTTVDNPYSPFSNFRQWYLYDMNKGYNTCGLLARLTYTTDSLTDEENDEEIERAIDEIIFNDVSGLYVKIKDKVEVN